MFLLVLNGDNLMNFTNPIIIATMLVIHVNQANSADLKNSREANV